MHLTLITAADIGFRKGLKIKSVGNDELCAIETTFGLCLFQLKFAFRPITVYISSKNY